MRDCVSEKSDDYNFDLTKQPPASGARDVRAQNAAQGARRCTTRARGTTTRHCPCIVAYSSYSQHLSLFRPLYLCPNGGIGRVLGLVSLLPPSARFPAFPVNANPRRRSFWGGILHVLTLASSLLGLRAGGPLSSFGIRVCRRTWQAL